MVAPRSAYTLETIDLKGHTFGQLGLFDKEHKIFFCADQVIDGIVPIVATTYPDEHLLRDYFVSLERFHHEFKDCLLYLSEDEAFRRQWLRSPGSSLLFWNVPGYYA